MENVDFPDFESPYLANYKSSDAEISLGDALEYAEQKRFSWFRYFSGRSIENSEIGREPSQKISDDCRLKNFEKSDENLFCSQHIREGPHQISRSEHQYSRSYDRSKFEKPVISMYSQNFKAS